MGDSLAIDTSLSSNMLQRRLAHRHGAADDDLFALGHAVPAPRDAEWSVLTPACLPNACCRSCCRHTLPPYVSSRSHTRQAFYTTLHIIARRPKPTSRQATQSCCQFPQCHFCSGSSAKPIQAQPCTVLHRIGPSRFSVSCDTYVTEGSLQ